MSRLTRPLPTERLRLTVILVVLGSLLLSSDFVKRLDLQLYDTLLQTADFRTSGNAAIIAIDETSLAQLGRWPWARETHARLIERLAKITREPLVFDTILAEPGDPATDQRLANAMKQQGNVWLPLHLQTDGENYLEFLPAVVFQAAARGFGHAHLPLDSDGIVRRLNPYEGSPENPWPALSVAVAQSVQGMGLSSIPRGVTARIPFSAIESIPRYSYVDVLQGRIPDEWLTHRTLFIGATAVGLGDALPTPVSGGRSTIPGVEIHATIYQALTGKGLIRDVATGWQRLLLIASILTIVLLFPRVPPHANLPLTLILSLTVLLFTVLALMVARQWISPAAPLLTTLLAYPIWSWSRLRNLNRFLNQELSTLAEERSPEMRLPNQTAMEWAHQLILFIKPLRWHIQTADQTLPDWVSRTPEEEGWVRDISLPGQHAKLYLCFEAAEAREPMEAYLNRLVAGQRQPTPTFTPRTALVERRIRQVKQATRSLRSMRRFVSETLETLPQGIILGDELGRIFYTNQQAADWLGRKIREGDTLIELLEESQPAERDGIDWKKALSSVLVRQQTITREWQQGEYTRLIRFAPLSLSIQGHNGVVASISDITPIRQAQRERLETIHFISHDLRSPLSSQLALLSRLQKEAKDFKTDISAFRQLEDLTRKSLELADDFLQLARVEAQSDIRMQPCLLIDLVDNATDTLSPLAAVSLLKLHVDADTFSETAFVEGNAGLLERCISNLISNAIKFSPQRGEILIRLKREGATLKLEVQDEGPGIEASELPTLFRSFQRTAHSEKQRKPGSGLGLRFVKTVVEKHGGDVGVISEAGEGACFWITLPLAPNNTETFSPATPESDS